MAEKKMGAKVKSNNPKNTSINNIDHFLSLLAPIMSISIFVLGMGALTTYTTLRLEEFGVSDLLIGLISAFYFGGLMIGGYKGQHLVLRVGHIRSYAAFSSIFAVSALLQGLLEFPWLWTVLRFVGGFCLAGCFLVVESWLLGASTRKNRGIILAIYMISYYGGQGLGQFFLNIPGITPSEVYMIGALFFTLSILPVSTTRFHAPYAEEPNILSFSTLNKKAPTAIWSAVAAGFILAVIYSLYPLYLSYAGLDKNSIANLMAGLLLGATASQYPVGWLSDRYDRRIIIAAVTLCTFLVALAIAFDHHNFIRILIYSMLLGAASFTIYPLSINYGVDHFTSKDLISATASMMLAYGVGSTIGPQTGAIFMRLAGFNGFIYVVLLISSLLFLYVCYRIKFYEGLAQDEKSQYVPIPDTTVEVVQMDLGVKEKDIDARHIQSIED